LTTAVFAHLLTVSKGSLCPDSAEEAKTLVPSLEGKISDEDLQELLDEMMKLRNFVQ
jgi:DNA-directed RNA polymerase II subunit RPB4